MALRTFTTQQKLYEIELLIQDSKTAETDVDVDVLKAIAADLRGRLAGAPSVALVEIERRINSVARSKIRGAGYSDGAMKGLAEEVVCRWPVIKQALERFSISAMEKV